MRVKTGNAIEHGPLPAFGVEGLLKVIEEFAGEYLVSYKNTKELYSLLEKTGFYFPPHERNFFCGEQVGEDGTLVLEGNEFEKNHEDFQVTIGGPEQAIFDENPSVRVDVDGAFVSHHSDGQDGPKLNSDAVHPENFPAKLDGIDTQDTLHVTEEDEIVTYDIFPAIKEEATQETPSITDKEENVTHNTSSDVKQDEYLSVTYHSALDLEEIAEASSGNEHCENADASCVLELCKLVDTIEPTGHRIHEEGASIMLSTCDNRGTHPEPAPFNTGICAADKDTEAALLKNLAPESVLQEDLKSAGIHASNDSDLAAEEYVAEPVAIQLEVSKNGEEGTENIDADVKVDSSSMPEISAAKSLSFEA